MFHRMFRPRTEPATVINWQQFTKNAETQKPMHAENGPPGRHRTWDHGEWRFRWTWRRSRLELAGRDMKPVK